MCTFLKNEVRKHFNCSQLEGAELEDQGEIGTKLTLKVDNSDTFTQSESLSALNNAQPYLTASSPRKKSKLV